MRTVIYEIVSESKETCLGILTFPSRFLNYDVRAS